MTDKQWEDEQRARREEKFSKELEKYKESLKTILTKNLKKMRYYGCFYGSMEEARLYNAKRSLLYAELNTREHVPSASEVRKIRGRQKRNPGKKRKQK